MPDINITALLSPLPVPGVQSNIVTGNPTGKLSSVLSNLLPGTVISGFVLNRDATGNPILRTDQGDLLIETDLFLKIGSDVTARIEKHGNKTQANILTVDGLPPAAAQARQHVDQPDIIGRNPGTAQHSPGTAPATQRSAFNVTQTATTSTAATTPRQPLLEAIVIGPSTNNATANNSLPAGTLLGVRIIAAEPAHAAKAANPATPPQTAATNVANAQPQTTTTNASAYAAYGRSFIFPPAQPIQTNATSTIPAQIQATIIASEPDGTLIAQSPLGLLKFPILSKLSAGGTLQLTIVSATPPSPAAVSAGTVLSQLPPGLQLSQQWPTLQEIIDVVLQESFSSKEALAALQARIPWVALANAQGGASMPTSTTLSSPLMFFMSAMMNGSVRSWLGEHTIRLLEENGHTPLLDQADSEFSQLANLARNTSSQGWQSVFFPIMTGEQIQMARLFVRRDRKNSDNATGADDTRFMVEVELSQLGELQLDGLVRKSSSRKAVFDLIIRSETALPREMQQEIIAIYDSAGELTDFTGTLLFQQVTNLPQSPVQDLLTPRQDEPPDILA